MAINIAFATEEAYDAGSYLIDSLRTSPDMGYLQIRDLLLDLPGCEIKVVPEDDDIPALEENLVHIFYYDTFCGLLASSCYYRVDGEQPKYQAPPTPRMHKFKVQYRDQFLISQYIHIFGFDEADVKMVMERDGVGYANGQTVFARRIESITKIG
jgi:hypothetical protein